MKFKNSMHTYQKKVVRHLIENPFSGVFVDMGMGKTASVLYAFKKLKSKNKKARMLIIAPKFVALNTWSDEIKKWEDLNDLTYTIAVGNEDKRLDAFSCGSDIVIINRENTVWMVKSVSMKSFTVLCMDELSSFKNPDSQRFKGLSKILDRFEYRWGLTGTPLPNGYLDIWSQMYLIDPNILGFNFYSFQNRYFHKQSEYTWVLLKDSEKKINDKLKQNCISLSVSDWLEMPDKIENHISIGMDSKGIKTYLQALEELVYISTEKTIDLDTNLVIKLQQLASGFIYKDDNLFFDIIHTSMLDKLEDLLDYIPGNTLLFYNFKAEKEMLKYRFKFARELLSSHDFEDWNEGKIRMAVCHPASVGYGLNLQSGGNNIIWYGYNWSSDIVLQANARLYRQGQSKAVVINYLGVKDTIHERMKKRVGEKISKQEILIEAVKYCKDMIK